MQNQQHNATPNTTSKKDNLEEVTNKISTQTKTPRSDKQEETEMKNARIVGSHASRVDLITKDSHQGTQISTRDFHPNFRANSIPKCNINPKRNNTPNCSGTHKCNITRHMNRHSQTTNSRLCVCRRLSTPHSNNNLYNTKCNW